MNEDIVLDPALRESYGALTGTYYICLWGYSMASFKLSARNEDHTVMLKPGLAEAIKLGKDEVRLYYFTDKILRDPKAEVRFVGEVLSGSALLRVKLCPLPSDISKLQESCNYTLEELQAPDPEEQVVGAMGAERRVPDEGICAPGSGFAPTGIRDTDKAQCIYVVGLLGQSDHKSHVTVMVEVQDPVGQKHPIVMSEGVPQVRSLQIRESDTYVISIDDDDIVKLTI